MVKKKIYVAGKFEERALIHQVQERLQQEGHSITSEWTTRNEDSGEVCAARDLEGVKACDTYVGWFMLPNSYRGALVELGAALALGKTVCVIGHAVDSCVFVDHPEVHQFETLADCCKFLNV